MIDLNIVLIDEDKELLNVINNFLRDRVKSTKLFTNLDDAYEYILKYPADLIITDVKVNGESGLKMYKKLKMNKIYLPLIVASNFSEPEYFKDAILQRVNNFLIKPINNDELLDEIKFIEKILQKRKYEKEREELLIVQSKMAEMGDMIQNIAHQWKQPLNTLSICASICEIEKEYDEKIITNMKNSISYMNQTIHDFHNYFEHKKVKQVFHLKDTISKVESLISAQIKTKQINIIQNIDQNVSVNSYENELIQVLINLIKNAIDELIKTDYKRYLFIDINSDSYGNVVIKVTDNAGGVNIDENINTIFEKHFTTKEEKGTGIGLYMSSIIVKNNLQGKLSVENKSYLYENEEQRGAEFTIVLDAGEK